MVSRLQEVNRFVRDTVHEPVFLADTPRPAARQHISKRLGLSQPLERIPHHGVHQIHHSDCRAAFGFRPITGSSRNSGRKTATRLGPRFTETLATQSR